MPNALNRFHLLLHDALTIMPHDVLPALSEQPFTLVANLPYNVATPIVLTLLERFPQLQRFVVMVQKEVADRLTATPGSKVFGAPSAKLAWYGEAKRVGLVGRHVFWPAPNVDSALVGFERHAAPFSVTALGASNAAHAPTAFAAPSTPNTSSVAAALHAPTVPVPSASPAVLSDTDAQHLRRETFRIIDAAFAQRRKTLHAALRDLVPDAAFAAAHIDPTRRGETLSVQEFAQLAYCATR